MSFSSIAPKLAMFWRAFILALTFLTRIPAPQLKSIEQRDMGMSALFYPLIGLIIGGLLCLPLLIFEADSSLLVAAIIVIAWAIVTGGLHLDGLADSADAWLGGMGDEQKTHDIMKDPRVGSAGAIAISGLMILKVAAVEAVISHQYWIALLLAPVLARGLIVILMITTPYIRSDGISKMVTQYVPKQWVWLVVGLVISIALWVSSWGLMVVLFVLWLLRRLMMRRLKGYSGDTLGGAVEVCEVGWLVGVMI